MFGFRNPIVHVKLNNFFLHEDVDSVLVDNNLRIIAETNANVHICIKVESEVSAIYMYGWDLGVLKIADDLYDFIDSLELEAL